MKLTRMLLFTAALLLGLFALMLAALPAQAQESQPTPTADGNPHVDNNCITCHNRPMQGQTLNGEVVSLTYDPAEHPATGHFMGCTGCHQDQQVYPHAGSTNRSCAICHTEFTGNIGENTNYYPLLYEDARAITFNINQGCLKCHGLLSKQIAASAHTKVLEEGNRFAPVCSDCHTAHDIVSPNEPRTAAAEICAQCHKTEYTTYRTSIHGAALANISNPDVPTCTDCHGAHDVIGAKYNNDFRADAAEMCGKCHANSAIMDKYGLSTDVLVTYLDDVHGTTNVLGELEQINITKVSCYDCHGIHNIRSVKDPASRVYPDNLQSTCAQCHKDAGIAFPSSWLSHQKPSLAATPGLYLTNVFALGGVIGAVGLVAVLIMLDARRRLSESLAIRVVDDSVEDELPAETPAAPETQDDAPAKGNPQP